MPVTQVGNGATANSEARRSHRQATWLPHDAAQIPGHAAQPPGFPASRNGLDAVVPLNPSVGELVLIEGHFLLPVRTSVEMSWPFSLCRDWTREPAMYTQF